MQGAGEEEKKASQMSREELIQIEIEIEIVSNQSSKLIYAFKSVITASARGEHFQLHSPATPPPPPLHFSAHSSPTLYYPTELACCDKHPKYPKHDH